MQLQESPLNSIEHSHLIHSHHSNKHNKQTLITNHKQEEKHHQSDT